MKKALKEYLREPSFHRGAWMVAMGFITGLFLKVMLDFLGVWPVCPHKKQIARLEAEVKTVKQEAQYQENMFWACHLLNRKWNYRLEFGRWPDDSICLRWRNEVDKLKRWPPDTLKYKPMKGKN